MIEYLGPDLSLFVFVAFGLLSLTLPIIYITVKLKRFKKTAIVIWILLWTPIGYYMTNYINQAAIIIAQANAERERNLVKEAAFPSWKELNELNPKNLTKNLKRAFALLRGSKMADEAKVELERLNKKMEAGEKLEQREIQWLWDRGVETGNVPRPPFIRSIHIPKSAPQDVQQIYNDAVIRDGKFVLIDSAADAYRSGRLRLGNGEEVGEDAYGGIIVRRKPGSSGPLLLEDTQTKTVYNTADQEFVLLPGAGEVGVSTEENPFLKKVPKSEEVPAETPKPEVEPAPEVVPEPAPVEAALPKESVPVTDSTFAEPPKAESVEAPRVEELPPEGPPPKFTTAYDPAFHQYKPDKLGINSPQGKKLLRFIEDFSKNPNANTTKFYNKAQRMLNKLDGTAEKGVLDDIIWDSFLNKKHSMAPEEAGKPSIIESLKKRFAKKPKEEIKSEKVEPEVQPPIRKAEQAADAAHPQNDVSAGSSVENEFFDSVVENGEPAASAKPKNKSILWRDDLWNKNKEKIRQSAAAAEKIKEIQNVRQNIEDAYKAILTNRKNLNKLDPADPRVPIIKEDLDQAYTTFSKQLETLNRLENKDFSSEWPQAVAAKGVIPENAHYSQNGNSIILSAKGMSVEDAAALQAQNPEAITLLGRDQTGAIQIGVNTEEYLKSLPLTQRTQTELNMRTITGENNPFTRSKKPLQRDSLANGVPELIDRQIETIRNLERKRVIQKIINDATGVNKTEGDLATARGLLSKYEKLTPEAVTRIEQELNGLNSSVNPNLTLDADLNRLQFTADTDLERRLFDMFPTEESRRVIKGFKIIPKGSEYYPETLNKNPGGIATTTPGRKAEKTIIVPEYIHVSDGITSSSGKELPPLQLPNDLSNLIRKPSKGEMTWKFKSPLEESTVTDIKSMLENSSSPVDGLSIKNIDSNGITFNSKFPLYKAFRDSGVGRDSFGTQFADAYYLGGAKDANGDPAGVIKGMGILPKTTAGLLGISTPVVGAMLADSSTARSNTQLNELKNPFLQTTVDGNVIHIINPYGSHTMLNADGTYVSSFQNPGGGYTYVETNPAEGREKITKTDRKGNTVGKPQNTAIEKQDINEESVPKVDNKSESGTGDAGAPAANPKTEGSFLSSVVPESFNFTGGHSLFGTLAGGAIGAGIGGLNYILTDENELSEEEKKKRSLARAMLSSAGIGAGIGGLVGGTSDFTRRA